ncbi:glycoside hydrolase superfamily [Amylocarpus encephaloides]|uniref:alpha-galactosidase n=1 Tax=Amylocarpus encephaloides TaxID=45428 RepID=A0A9P7YIE7_9HELO|nr:glycoside hydrolase superfamily [Amylocarpus encephaloides]
MLKLPWSSSNAGNENKDENPSEELPHRRACCGRTRRFWLILGMSAVLSVAAALGLGLGLGLGRGGSDGDGRSDSDSPSFVQPSGNSTTQGVNGTFWQPSAGASWQIVLQQPLHSFTPNVSIFDIDLFENNASIITQLHAMNAKVICYFSAGSYESFRPDTKDFNPLDYGNELKGWPGEKWLDLRSPNVRAIMKKRLKLAAELGCDGVDPDNVDGFVNDSGFPLTRQTALDFLNFLAAEAHALKLAIGLKNAGDIVKDTTSLLQWVVNEQCVAFGECALFRPFIDEGKPVFHIEYISEKGNSDVSTRTRSEICGVSDEAGFSTLMKKADLGDWVEAC